MPPEVTQSQVGTSPLPLQFMVFIDESEKVSSDRIIAKTNATYRTALGASFSTLAIWRFNFEYSVNPSVKDEN
jgi:hypothetical protein